MAQTLTRLANAISANATATSVTTAAIAPVIGRVIFAFISDWRSATPFPVTTLSHPAVTWTQQVVKANAADDTRIYLFTGIPSATTSSAVTIASTSATGQGQFAWSIFDLGNGIDLTTPIVQTATAELGAGSTPGNITLGSAPAASNPTISGWYGGFHTTGYTGTPDTGWTEIDDQYNIDLSAQQTQWKDASGDQTGSVTWSTGPDDHTWGIVAEVKLAAVVSDVLRRASPYFPALLQM